MTRRTHARGRIGPQAAHQRTHGPRGRPVPATVRRLRRHGRIPGVALLDRRARAAHLRRHLGDHERAGGTGVAGAVSARRCRVPLISAGSKNHRAALAWPCSEGLRNHQPEDEQKCDQGGNAQCEPPAEIPPEGWGKGRAALVRPVCNIAHAHLQPDHGQPARYRHGKQAHGPSDPQAAGGHARQVSQGHFTGPRWPSMCAYSGREPWGDTGTA